MPLANVYFQERMATRSISAGEEAAVTERFLRVRKETGNLVRGLPMEDLMVQPWDWVSPPKWHLAHTTWFFENFLLCRFLPGYRITDPGYGFLFNSYYESVGKRADKARRGTYSRPTVAEVLAYRARVDSALGDLLSMGSGPSEEIRALVELGIHHEQQHQELLLADIKSILYNNPSRPGHAGLAEGDRAYLLSRGNAPADPLRWMDFSAGLRDIGWGGEGFSFDNEGPLHRVWLEAFRIRDRPVTNRQYLEFVEDGGYTRPGLWLSDGWKTVVNQGWEAPLYWEKAGSRWSEFTWKGMGPLDAEAPVRHASYFEADAFARWSRARLPTEYEWEAAAREREWILPGQVWEWTASAYLPYPGFRPLEGAVGEYNGKFMVDQMVLRGGSSATPQGHIRLTYRNFFPAATRWQFSGIRLAESR